MKRGGPLRRLTPLQPGASLRRVTPLRAARSRRAIVRDTGPSRVLRAAVLERDRHCCQRCGRSILGRAYSLQHRLPRGRGGGNSLANLVTLCGSATSPGCHAAVESYRTSAIRDGFLVPTSIDPADWPVHRYLSSWAQPSDSWVPTDPRPEQVLDAA